MEEPKDCECGGKATDEDVFFDIDGRFWRVYCEACGKSTGLSCSYSLAVEEWNNGELVN